MKLNIHERKVTRKEIRHILLYIVVATLGYFISQTLSEYFGKDIKLYVIGAVAILIYLAYRYDLTKSKIL